MQHYDFDRPVQRRGTNSYKWDIIKQEGVIPLWVADMDFEVAPPIAHALQKRVEHAVYGYTLVPDSYYEAIVGWFKRRHQWTIDRHWIIYTTGVVPAVSCAIKSWAMPGEKVLVQTPVYNCFFSSIRNQGCELIENPLIREGDSYRIDFEDFEKKCADNKTTLFLLCNPHNPAGRVWTKEELEHMNDICLKHHVRVISDEIHCELVMPGHTFTPFAAISKACRDNSVTLNSPSKSFNIAGLQIANIICADAEWRQRIDRVINIYEACDVNPFGVIALQAAYNEGEDWLDELNLYLWNNYLAMKTNVEKYLSKAQLLRLEGTYLAWLDVSAYHYSSNEIEHRLIKEAKVYVNSGTMYGEKAGEGYLRINLACPRATLMEGLQRITRWFEQQA